jgi:hypothetical protein
VQAWEKEYEKIQKVKEIYSKESRDQFKSLIPVVINTLTSLVAAADESSVDIKAVLEAFKYFRKTFEMTEDMQKAVSRLLTLVFSGKDATKGCLIDFFSETYLNLTAYTYE